jgi:hypothetical protein
MKTVIDVVGEIAAYSLDSYLQMSASGDGHGDGDGDGGGDPTGDGTGAEANIIAYTAASDYSSVRSSSSRGDGYSEGLGMGDGNGAPAQVTHHTVFPAYRELCLPFDLNVLFKPYQNRNWKQRFRLAVMYANAETLEEQAGVLALAELAKECEDEP